MSYHLNLQSTESPQRNYDGLVLDYERLERSVRLTRPPFFLRRFETPLSLVDLDGRPLLESQAPPESQVGLELDYIKCPYPDARIGRLMNLSALRQLNRERNSVLAGLRYIRSMFVKKFAITDMTSIDMLGLACTTTALPSFLAYHDECNYAHDQIPTQAAVLFKIAAGVSMLLRKLVCPTIPVKMNADAIMKRALASGLLLGDIEACAGPSSNIREILNIFLGDDDNQPTELNVNIQDNSAFLEAGRCLRDFALLVSASEYLSLSLLEPIIPLLEEADQDRYKVLNNPHIKQSTELLGLLVRLGIMRTSELENLKRSVTLVEINSDLKSQLHTLRQFDPLGPVVDIKKFEALLPSLMATAAVRSQLLSVVSRLEKALCLTLNKVPSRMQLDWIDARECLCLQPVHALESAFGGRIDIICGECYIRLGTCALQFPIPTD